ncbi:uncharacterized protein BX664DRAFT_329880 [Halteromyces radiatus]|uniref:uncharacterized protein n=1 Tax=Halteromyces radiatus TaxID=101107 RepID=UPI0022200178|nr:uncharacterized protein BX664DRAFT_329880 [Halteromyces radiatus]KAI8093510.1 hypothetical protein BX664DRAFT_329880 [Halteromyces radiatus]
MVKPSSNHPSTKANSTQNGFSHRKKNTTKAPALPESCGKINKRIRDLKRTLSKANVSPKARVESERRLIQLKYLYGERKIDEKEKEMATKYHAIKHFERKKVQRKLKTVRKQIDETTDKESLEKLENKLQEILLDEMYINHFPKTIPYASLYATTEDDSRSSKKQEIRQQIKQVMEKGTGFDDFQATYRQQWRATLIKQGIIEDATPVMDELIETTEDTNTATESDLKDDFFET